MKQLNVQQQMDKLLDSLKSNNVRPTLLLHVCCAPCSSYVLEYLSGFFDITVFYYNPNIEPESEYLKRADELQRFLKDAHYSDDISLVTGEYENELYHENIKGLENEPERGKRCVKCFEMRLEKTAELAKTNHFDYFTTSLSISPHKDADLLNDIGERAAQKYNVRFLPSDFKKKGGYLRSIELSREYDLYRQDYCGCIYSKSNQ